MFAIKIRFGKYALYLALVILHLNGSLVAQNTSNSGTVAAPFLLLSADPRGSAMGNAGSVSRPGISSAIWNPAALSDNRHTFFASHGEWFAEINLDQIGVNISAGNFGNIGAYLSMMNYGEMEVRTATQQDGTGERFNASDMSLSVYYARDITDRLKIGASFKYIQQRIWHSSAQTAAVDIGTIFRSPILGLDFGASISNFGGDMRMSGRDTRVQHDIDPPLTGNNPNIPANLELQSWPLPVTLRSGISRKFATSTHHVYTVVMDAYYPQDNLGSLNFGMEYSYRKSIHLRAGYRGLFLEENEGGISGGIGIGWRTGNSNWHLDVAVVDYGLLDTISVFAIGLRW